MSEFASIAYGFAKGSQERRNPSSEMISWGRMGGGGGGQGGRRWDFNGSFFETARQAGMVVVR